MPKRAPTTTAPGCSTYSYRTDRIRYKDTIQGYDTKYDTRILLTIGKIKSPKNQIKTYALDLMNMVMITHCCNRPTFW